MKYFVMEGEYLVPWEELADLVAEHRAFLRRGYQAGHFLCSGPQIPARGGIMIARAESLEQLMALFAEEPYTLAGKMRFSRVIEFNPVLHQPFMDTWCEQD